MALGIGAGDEVITPAFSFFASAGCIARVGATPVFADIERDGFNIDPLQVEQLINPNTKAVIAVHLFGRAANLDTLKAICEAHKIDLIEDVAQSFGTRVEKEAEQTIAAGTCGTAGCFSFFPTKNLGGLGDGGLVTTQSDTFAEKLRVFRAHGAKPKYYHPHIGGNFRLDALQAACLDVKLAHVDRMLEQRATIARHYQIALSAQPTLRDKIVLPKEEIGRTWNQYTIRVPNHRDQIIGELKIKGIGTAVYYPEPLHRQPCFRNNEAYCAQADRASQECLSLPMGAHINPENVARVADAIGSSPLWS